MEISPTRSELIEINNKIRLAKRGHSLLKKKQDVLIMELFRRLREYRKFKQDIVQSTKKAYKDLALDIALTGVFVAKSVSYSTQQQFSIEHEQINIMGLKLPRIQAVKKDSPVVGVFENSPQLLQATRSFHTLFGQLVKLSSEEITIKALTEEISKIKRRVNSLENIQIPKLESVKKHIQFVLEEQERENFIKLKAIKELLEV